MKKSILLFLIATISFFGHAQTSHIVTAFDFGFAPENLTLAPGDTVYAIFNGYHSMTEVSESDWNSNLANSNGGFWIGFGAPTFEDYFVVSEEGLKYYICVPHAEMGMKGTLNVVNPTVGIDVLTANDVYNISTLGNGKFTLSFSNCEAFTILTTSGKTIETIALNNLGGQIDIDLSGLSSGIYLGVFVENGKGVKVVKFLR